MATSEGIPSSIDIEFLELNDNPYVIPIADIKRAGINSTGAKIENDLEPLLDEFTKYRKENNLWHVRNAKTSYQYNYDGKLTRIQEFDGMVSEPEIFYNID